MAATCDGHCRHSVPRSECVICTPTPENADRAWGPSDADALDADALLLEIDKDIRILRSARELGAIVLRPIADDVASLADRFRSVYRQLPRK